MFLDETGFLLRPLNRRTWALRGQTPVQYCLARHDRLSAIGALTISPRRGRIHPYWRLYDDNIVATDVVQFLRWLHRALRNKLIAKTVELSRRLRADAATPFGRGIKACFSSLAYKATGGRGVFS